MKLAIPRAYLGTMTFGWSSQTSSVVDESVALEMVKRFTDFSSTLMGTTTPLLIDTARVYASGNTETIVGQVLQNFVFLGSKYHIVQRRLSDHRNHTGCCQQNKQSDMQSPKLSY